MRRSDWFAAQTIGLFQPTSCRMVIHRLEPVNVSAFVSAVFLSATILVQFRRSIMMLDVSFAMFRSRLSMRRHYSQVLTT